MSSIAIFDKVKSGDLRSVWRWRINNPRVKIQEIHDTEGWSPVGHAACYRQLDILKYFIEECGVCPYRTEHRVKQTLLHMAAGQGSLETTRYLVEECGIDPMILNGHGETPCSVAICLQKEALECLRICRFFVEECNIDTNHQEYLGYTILHNAAKHGPTELVRILLEDHQVSCDIRENDGYTPVMLACTAGKVDTVKCFARLRPDSLSARTRSSNGTLLHIAIRFAQIDVLKYLVDELNLDVMERDNSGSTAVLLAFDLGFFDGFAYLVRRSSGNSVQAQIHGCTNDGFTPAHYCCGVNGSLKACRFLSTYAKPALWVKGTNAPGTKPLHLASKNGLLDCVKFLVKECGVDCSCVDDDGETPLHFACSGGHIEVVQYLVEECGANPLQKGTDEFGWTPLMSACFRGSLEIVKYLAERDQEMLKIKNAEGQSALHVACDYGHLGIVKYLIDTCGADMMLRDSNGYTPFYCACSKTGDINVVKYFVEELGVDTTLKSRKGSPCVFNCATKPAVVEYLVNICNADVHAVNSEGNSSLFFAAIEGNLDDIKYLVEECGVKTDVVNTAGETPLHMACQYNNHLDVIQYLVKCCGIPFNVGDNEGRTAVHLACMHQLDKQDLMEYLIHDYDADMTRRDNLGRSPIFYACRDGSLDMIYSVLRSDGFTSASIALGLE